MAPVEVEFKSSRQPNGIYISKTTLPRNGGGSNIDIPGGSLGYAWSPGDKQLDQGGKAFLRFEGEEALELELPKTGSEVPISLSDTTTQEDYELTVRRT